MAEAPHVSRARATVLCMGVVLFVCIVLMGLQPIRSADVWHHIASGRLVWENGWPAEREVFSHTALGKRWIQFEWLAQLLIFLGYTKLGAAGIILVKSLTIACGFMLLWLACRRRADAMAGGVVVFFAALAFANRSYVRPEFISILLFGCFILLLERGRQREPPASPVPTRRDGGASRLLFLLPVIAMVWANTHGLYAAALGLLGIVCCAETARLFWRSRGPVGTPLPCSMRCASLQGLPARRVLILWGILVACAISTLINPYGVRIWSVPLELMRSHDVADRIAEWGQPTGSIFLEPAYLGVWVLCLMTLATIRWADLTDLLVLCAFGFLAMRARRNIPLFAFACAPIFARHLSILVASLPHPAVAGRVKVADPSCVAVPLRRVDAPKSPTLHGFGGAALWRRSMGRGFTYRLAGILVVFTWLYMGPPDFSKLGLGVRRGKYPIGAAEFIRTRKISGNLFNTYHFGNYLLWRLFPSNLVFIDGRIDMYGGKLLREYGSLRDACEGWNEKLVERCVVAAVVQMSQDERDAEPILSRLFESKDWRLVYWDDVALVFVRSAVGPRGFTIRPDTFDAQAVNEETLRRAMDEFRSVIAFDPGCLRARDRLAHCYERLGRFDDALPHLMRVAEAQPRSGIARYNAGACLIRLGKYAEGAKQLRAALQYGAPKRAVLLNLGNARFGQHDYAGALRFYREVLKLAPEDWGTRWNFVRALEQMGRYDEAIRELERLSAASPADARVREKLRELKERVRGR